MEIDIKSCEPGILYCHFYNKKYDDLYTQVCRDLNLNIPRAKAKVAIISIIYGASVYKTKKLSGLSEENVIKIRNLFKIDSINNYLNAEFVD